ncbi:MAG: hypothetical protein JXR49_21545 [Acidobacteria bacterium]|nr:hypothetical protein [Acidobacteriota bacterium]
MQSLIRGEISPRIRDCRRNREAKIRIVVDADPDADPDNAIQAALKGSFNKASGPNPEDVCRYLTSNFSGV